MNFIFYHHVTKTMLFHFYNNIALKLQVLKIFDKSFVPFLASRRRSRRYRLYWSEGNDPVTRRRSLRYCRHSSWWGSLKHVLLEPLCDTRGSGHCCRGSNRDDVCNNDGNFGGQRCFDDLICMIWQWTRNLLGRPAKTRISQWINDWISDWIVNYCLNKIKRNNIKYTIIMSVTKIHSHDTKYIVIKYTTLFYYMYDKNIKECNTLLFKYDIFTFFFSRNINSFLIQI